MSKGPSQVGTQNTSRTDPSAAAQQPYLEDIWSRAQNLYNTQAPQPYPINTWANPDPSGYQAMQATATGTLPGVAGAAANPYYAGTSGAYSGYNSPAYGGFQNIAGGGSYGQQAANQATGAMTGLAGQAAGTGNYYGGQIGQTAAGIPGAVADPLAMMRQQASGYYLPGQAGGNPYLSGMYGAAAGDVTRAYQTATAPRTESSFEGAGRYGSGAMANAVSQNEQNLGTTLRNLASNIYGNAYGQERGLQNAATQNLGALSLDAQRAMMSGYGQAGQTAQAGYQNAGNLYSGAGSLGLSGTDTQQRALNAMQGGYQTGNQTALDAARLAPTIQQSYLAGPTAQVAAGAGLTAQQQAQLDASRQQWADISNLPFQNLQLYNQLIGRPIGGSYEQQQPIYGSNFAQTIGGIGSAALGFAKLLPMLSDRRLKEDDKVVGHLGRLPLHSFRYKGGSDRHIGFMADEVERVDPGAVVTTNLGFKAVDYGRAATSALEG